MIKYSFDFWKIGAILYNVTSKSLLRETFRFSALLVLISLSEVVMIDSLAFANFVKHFECGCFRPGCFVPISNDVEIMFDGEYEQGNPNGGSETWFKFTFVIDKAESVF